MKKSLLFIFVFATTLLWQTAKAENLFSKDLYFGIQNDSDVTKLQEFLTSEGIYSGPITGNFFSLTLKAVKDYQTREGISPTAGYFGPITREKANLKLSIQIQESENQAVGETGSPAVPVIQPKTTTDVVATMQSQLNTLLQQVALLQQQLQSQQQTQQTIQDLQSQVTQQTQVLQQIQQNTTPSPVIPPPVIEKKKELKAEVYKCVAILRNAYTQKNELTTLCEIEVNYFEDNERTSGEISIWANDDGGFFGAKDCTGGEITQWESQPGVFVDTGRKGNPLTCPASFFKKSGKDGKPTAFFTYWPSATGDRMITVSVNGISDIITSSGRAIECVYDEKVEPYSGKEAIGKVVPMLSEAQCLKFGHLK